VLAEPGEQHAPAIPAPPIPEPPSPVASISDAKKEGIEEHKKYVSSVTDLCTLANAAERVGPYVRAGTPIEQVRKELLDMRAQATVLAQHPVVPQPTPATAWGKITDKLNARVKTKGV
jgi:hypothetical protein